LITGGHRYPGTFFLQIRLFTYKKWSKWQNL